MDVIRAEALRASIQLHGHVHDLGLHLGVDAAVTIAADEKRVLDTAEVFLAWLKGATKFHLVPGPILSQTTGQPTGNTPQEGVPVQIHDDEMFDLTLVETDSKGFPTSGANPPVWTSSNEAAVPVSVSDDGMTFHVVAGAPALGTVIQVDVTKEDGTVVSATESVDVVAGDVALISLTEGAVTKQA